MKHTVQLGLEDPQLGIIWHLVSSVCSFFSAADSSSCIFFWIFLWDVFSSSFLQKPQQHCSKTGWILIAWLCSNLWQMPGIQLTGWLLMEEEGTTLFTLQGPHVVLYACFLLERKPLPMKHKCVSLSFGHDPSERRLITNWNSCCL